MLIPCSSYVSHQPPSLLLLLLLQVLQPDDVFATMSALLDSRPELR
jgi:hypothetical protein